MLQPHSPVVQAEPVFRRLRGYAFDPSLSNQLDYAFINTLVFKINWKDYTGPGPIGEYLEVVDYDPASKLFYAPVDLNDPFILALDGIDPSEGNPQFHQQMVYAVAMTTIQNFEKALGRWVLWSERLIYDRKGEKIVDNVYVPRLRIYPHALREANAFYNPNKKAILFGYFPALSDNIQEHLPGGMVFTCLSHDIIAHEITHAILDGINTKLIDPTNLDCLAFHEAFSDIVALFQHFTFPEVIRNQISKTKGDLQSQNLLGQLAQQFGNALGYHGSLRDAIGRINPDTQKWEPSVPDPSEILTKLEPHDRGSILVAAIFDAFTQIYKRRIADLLRISSEGTGILREGELHPDLVNRMAREASKTAQHVLNMCIRALDYCPPVDLTFGDFLRAIITADYDLVPEDEWNYRLAFVEAFQKRGIYPEGVKSLSVDSLRWSKMDEKYEIDSLFGKLAGFLREFQKQSNYFSDREKAFKETQKFQTALHEHIISNKSLLSESELKEFEEVTGLYFLVDATYQPGDTRDHPFMKRVIQAIERRKHEGIPKFTVRSVAFNRRVPPQGKALNHVVVSLTQRVELKESGLDGSPVKIKFRAGCQLIFDLDSGRLLYAIKKDISQEKRFRKLKQFLQDEEARMGFSAFAKTFDISSVFGQFSAIHNNNH